ncbi:MAG: cupin domain-containing protein [Hymenobacter sp.]
MDTTLNQLRPLRPYLSNRELAPAFWALGILWLPMATGVQTGNRLTLLEQEMVAGNGPPAHFHPYDEGFYILEGEITFRVGGATHRVGAGTALHIPRLVQHSFTVELPSRVLNFYPASGFELLLFGMGQPAAARRPPTPQETRPLPPEQPGDAVAAGRPPGCRHSQPPARAGRLRDAPGGLEPVGSLPDYGRAVGYLRGAGQPVDAAARQRAHGGLVCAVRAAGAGGTHGGGPPHRGAARRAGSAVRAARDAPSRAGRPGAGRAGRHVRIYSGGHRARADCAGWPGPDTQFIPAGGFERGITDFGQRLDAQGQPTGENREAGMTLFRPDRHAPVSGTTARPGRRARQD